VPSDEILADWLPPDGLVCDILATSTSANWSANWTALRLDPLDEDDARALVKKVIRDGDAARRWVDQLVTSARGITVELVAAANAIDYEARHHRSGALRESLADETISSFGVVRFVREQSGPTISEAVRRRHLDGFLQAASRFCEHPADPQLAAGLRAYPANVTFWSTTVLPEDGAALDARARALGDGLRMDGRFDEARGWYERAVAQAAKGDVHGRIDHASLGGSLHAVGSCYAGTGK
jgi:hypothetical protein